MIEFKKPLRNVGFGMREEGEAETGRWELSLIYNHTLNHVEQMPFLVRH